MTTQQDLLSNLISLVQLDIDAVHAYRHAIDQADVPDISDHFKMFRADHERHIRELSDVIRSIGGEPPEMKPDFKGYLIEGFTELRSITGVEGVLKAMKSNEKITNKTYRAALSWVLPGKVYDIVRRGFYDEKRHLSYIDRMLAQRPWEEVRRAA